MLHFLSWGRFLTATLLLTASYYIFLSLLFYREKIFHHLRKKGPLLVICVLGIRVLHAQTADGASGITSANTMIRGYFDVAVQLLYAISSIIALIGAVRVFQHWNGGHQQDAYRSATAWFGSCIFLVIVATVIKSFFGI